MANHYRVIRIEYRVTTRRTPLRNEKSIRTNISICNHSHHSNGSYFLLRYFADERFTNANASNTTGTICRSFCPIVIECRGNSGDRLRCLPLRRQSLFCVSRKRYAPWHSILLLISGQQEEHFPGNVSISSFSKKKNCLSTDCRLYLPPFYPHAHAHCSVVT